MSIIEHNGYYIDKHGALQPDRRKTQVDRRAGRVDAFAHERRGTFRRKADRELYEKLHKVMIKEALEDFVQEQEGRV